jgi:thymidylate kinase
MALFAPAVAARVWLTGPPASGKSTVRECLEAWADERSIKYSSAGMEDIHRKLCPRELDSSEYYYDAEGALVLRNPTVQVRSAERELLDVSANTSGLIFLEAAFPDLGTIASKVAPLAFTNSLIFFLTAPLSVRLERNLRRGSFRIPKRAVIDYPNVPSDYDIQCLEQLGSEIVVIDTEEPKDCTVNHVLKAVEKWMSPPQSTLDDFQ